MAKAPDKPTSKIPTNVTRPLHEGRIVRGGVNANGSFDRRPPPPKPMKPMGAQSDTSSSKKR